MEQEQMVQRTVVLPRALLKRIERLRRLGNFSSTNPDAILISALVRGVEIMEKELGLKNL